MIVMKPNKMSRSLIKSITKKAIERIQENPEREIRNLVDLGSMFARGSFQKQFFHTAEKELAKNNSPYYKIVSEIIRKTDKDNLLTFGINLGYNSLTCGAAAIREFEEKSGYNVPWALIVELSAHGKLDAEILNQLISQGEELGICSYVLILNSDYSRSHDLAEVVKGHRDCAFLLCIEPDLDISDIENLQRFKNILIGVNVNFRDHEKTREVIRQLQAARLLCTAFYRPEGTNQIEIEKAARLAASLDCKLVFALHNDSFFIDNHEKIEKAVNELRLNIKTSVIPFDLMADVVMADRNISGEGCLAIVSENGDLRITNMKTKEQTGEYNIRLRSLKDIFHHALPKQ